MVKTLKTDKPIQITRYIGSPVTVTMKDETLVKGTLSFYNYENRTIHLNNYIITDKNKEMEQGTFVILNGDVWKDLKADGDLYE